jgi:hypothetical protein
VILFLDILDRCSEKKEFFSLKGKNTNLAIHLQTQSRKGIKGITGEPRYPWSFYLEIRLFALETFS